MVRMRSPVQIRLSAPKITDTRSGVRYLFYLGKRLITGFEGDCAERSEVKTVLWIVFKESADESFPTESEPIRREER